MVEKKRKKRRGSHTLFLPQTPVKNLESKRRRNIHLASSTSRARTFLQRARDDFRLFLHVRLRHGGDTDNAALPANVNALTKIKFVGKKGKGRKNKYTRQKKRSAAEVAPRAPQEPPVQPPRMHFLGFSPQKKLQLRLVALESSSVTIFLC